MAQNEQAIKFWWRSGSPADDHRLDTGIVFRTRHYGKWLTDINRLLCETPFTRYNRLSIGFDNRFDNRVERTTLFVQPVVKPCLSNRFDKHGLTNVLKVTVAVRSTGCQTGLYNRFDNRLYKRYSRLSNRFDNRFDNRLYCVNGALY